MQNSTEHIPSGKWEFDDEVTEVFEDMLQRSIPQYDVMRDSVSRLAREFAVENATIIDLGCSRGEALSRLVTQLGGYCNYIGVDISDPMLASCKERFSRYPESLVSVYKMDIKTEYPQINNACVVISNLTLQFTPIEYRQAIINNIYKSLLPGGAFIMVEKVLGSSLRIDQTLVSLYYELKGANGYSQESINRKKLSLEGVLVPVTAKWNEDLLVSAGFNYLECFWRWMNFAGWIAIK